MPGISFWQLNIFSASSQTTVSDRLVMLLSLFAFTAIGCEADPQTLVTETASPAPPESVLPQIFTLAPLPDSADLKHRVPAESFEMPLIMGGGCSIGDLNGDSLPDLITVAGADPANFNSGDMLNCGVLQQRSDGSFQNVTEDAGLLVRTVGMGCWLADLDHDGDQDALTTSSSGLTLLRNDSTAEQIRFTDVTQQSGLASSRWSTAASFTDFDRDGWLDLFVANYVDYFPGSQCRDTAGNPDYCGPQAFAGTTDLLFRNRGSIGLPFSFENITISCGLGSRAGRGLGTICTDLTGDRLIDIYVANDMEPNFLWVQQQDGTFREEASLRGCATDIQGRPQASMGTALSDLDRDGMQDMFLTHLRGESNTWYRQTPHGVFSDRTALTLLGETSREQTGFGVVTEDFNSDGFVDLCIVNGRVMRSPLNPRRDAEDYLADYSEYNQLYLGGRNAEFVHVGEADPLTQSAEISRGLAVGDVDGDGDSDLLVTGINCSPKLYLNTSPDNGHWLRISVIDGSKNRSATGARVVLHSANLKLERILLPSTGYLSSHSPTLHFGLGREQEFDQIDVYWPDEISGGEQFPGGAADRILTLHRGQGQRFETEDRGYE